MANIFDQFGPRPSETPSTSRRNIFDQFDRVATDNRQDEEFFGQGFISDFGIGSGNLVSGIGTLYGLASGNMDNAISQFGEETTRFYEDLQTEDQKRRQREFQQYVDGGADELDKAGRAIVGTITDPSLTFSFLTQQIAPLVASGGAGLAVRGATGAVRAGQAAGILSGAGLNAGDIAGGMYSDVMQLPEDVLQRNDAYRVRSAEIGPEEARKELALEGARNTALAVGALSTVTAGVLPSTIEKTLVGGVADNTTRIGNLTRGFVSEALQEAVEEGGGQAIANLNIQPLDPSRSLTEGVGQAAAQGGLLGGLMGGAVGGLSPTNRIAEAAERGANQARAEGGDALDQSARAAQEAAQVSTVDTINTPTGQTTIEMQGNQSDVDALRERFGINQGRVEPVILTPEETTIPTDEPLQPAPFDPLLTPTPFDPLDTLDLANRSINRAVVLNARDQRRALNDGDQATADALDNDSIKLRALQSRIRSARELQALPEAERVAGQSEMVENILREVGEAINQESGARQAFSYVNILEGELLPRIDESLQALRGIGALTPRQIAEGRQIAYQPPTDFEVDPEGQAGRPGERSRLEIEREAALEPVERRFDALVDAYEAGDTQPLLDELDQAAADFSDLQTRRTGTAVTTEDDVLTAITKAGGIDIEEAISQGLDPADNPGRGRLSLFRREGGMTFDGVAEFLAENGFTQRAGDTFEAGVQDANTALEIVADALNARADGNLTFLNSGKAAEIQEAQMRLDVAEQALFELKQTGQNLSPEDEVLIAQLYEEMYDEVYGRADTGRVARSAEEEIAPPRDNVIPPGDRGSEIQPQFEPRAPQSGSRELRQSDGPPQGRQSVTPQTGPQGPVFDFSAEKERLTKRLANFKTQDLADLLKEAGLRTVGNRQDKIDRIITFREAGALLNEYDSYESAEQALVRDNGLSPETIASYANALRRSGDRKAQDTQVETNLFSIYNALNQAGMINIPEFTPETQARRDEEAATREAESAQREQARASEDEQIRSWLEENRDQVTQWWSNATQEDRRRMLEDVAAYRVETGKSASMEVARTFGVGEGRQEARRLNTDDITKLPKSVSDAIIRWAPFNWDRFTGAEQTETLPAAEERLDLDTVRRDGRTAAERLRAKFPNPEEWSPYVHDRRLEDLGRITWDGRPGREDTKSTKKDYDIGQPLPVENKPGVWAREIRDPKGNLVGIVESTRDQSTALYLDEAGSYDVVGITPDEELYGGNTYPDAWHQRGAVYKIMDRVLREKKGEAVEPAQFTGRTEAPLLESYTEQDLQDRAAVDMEAGERRAQIDRERELFDLDSGQGTIAGTTDPTQTDGNQGGLFRRDRELGINRGATPRPVITDEEFDTVIDRVIGDNQEARARIVAVDSFADLPEPLQIAARKQGSDGSDVDAVTHRGQIYIVRGRMRSKARMERTLLHEGTHVGINAMYADEGVRRAMNRMYVAMGGAKGFNKMAKDLGIERQIAPYREGLAREDAVSEKVRNEILVNEMLAYVGERGSKTFQDRVREVIGAIRNWLRKNGLMTLANMRVSDITYIAKKARENGLRSETAKGDGEPAFSIVAEQPRARQTDLGLYSNAEQILLDQGDKIFKPSKKNPEGRVKGDQILSFLKARGLKKDEAAYTGLEAELTDVASTQRFTREEVIQILRDNRPDLVADVRTGMSNEDEALIYISDSEILDGQENYEHIIEDMRTDIFDAGADATDNFSLAELVTALYDYDRDIMKNMVSIDFPDMRLEAVDSKNIADIFEAYVSAPDNDLLTKRLVGAYGENLVDDTIVELAEQRYLDNPVYRYEVFNNDEDYIGEIIGNDDTEYILRDDNELGA